MQSDCKVSWCKFGCNFVMIGTSLDFLITRPANELLPNFISPYDDTIAITSNAMSNLGNLTTPQIDG